MLEASNGVLKLPLIKNKKTVNPRDSSSPPVFQLETAMGSAIECFDDSGAVVVPRERFAPVKTTNDLFALRSDVYKVHPSASFTPKASGKVQAEVAAVIDIVSDKSISMQNANALKQTMCLPHADDCQSLHY